VLLQQVGKGQRPHYRGTSTKWKILRNSRKKLSPRDPKREIICPLYANALEHPGKFTGSNHRGPCRETRIGLLAPAVPRAMCPESRLFARVAPIPLSASDSAICHETKVVGSDKRLNRTCSSASRDKRLSCTSVRPPAQGPLIFSVCAHFVVGAFLMLPSSDVWMRLKRRSAFLYHRLASDLRQTTIRY
jgi:hypothetical protein